MLKFFRDKKKSDISFTIAQNGDSAIDEIICKTSDTSKASPKPQSKMLSKKDSGFISESGSPLIQTKSTSNTSTTLPYNNTPQVITDDHPDQTATTSASSSRPSTTEKQDNKKQHSGWFSKITSRKPRKSEVGKPVETIDKVKMEIYPPDCPQTSPSNMRRISACDHLDVIAEEDVIQPQSKDEGLKQDKKKEDGMPISAFYSDCHTPRVLVSDIGSSSSPTTTTASSSTKNTPNSSRKWYQWNFYSGRKSQSEDKIADPSHAFKTVSIDDVPPHQEPLSSNLSQSTPTAISTENVTTTPVIQSPGKLPEGHKYYKRKSKQELNEEEEKALKRRDIVSIMRGKTKLVQEFSKKYQLVEVLGDGAFGFVFAAKVLKGSHAGKEAAVKFILIDKVSREGWVHDEQYGYIPFEIHFLRKVNHPNIIKFLDFYKDDRFFYLVTELHGVEWRPDNPILNRRDNAGLRDMPIVTTSPHSASDSLVSIDKMTDEELLARKRTAFDLFECIDVHKRIPDVTAKKIFAGIVKAVDYMHSIGFVHRDLKDENVVIDEQYDVKLIDFGSTSRIPADNDFDNYFDRFNGTLHFASPEILTGNNYRGPEAEVWALGVLLYTIIYGENPYRDPEDILRGQVGYFGRDSALSTDLLKRIFVADPAQRITLEGIKNHPWISEAFIPESLSTPASTAGAY